MDDITAELLELNGINYENQYNHISNCQTVLNFTQLMQNFGISTKNLAELERIIHETLTETQYKQGRGGRILTEVRNKAEIRDNPLAKPLLQRSFISPKSSLGLLDLNEPVDLSQFPPDIEAELRAEVSNLSSVFKNWDQEFMETTTDLLINSSLPPGSMNPLPPGLSPPTLRRCRGGLEAMKGPRNEFTDLGFTEEELSYGDTGIATAADGMGF